MANKRDRPDLVSADIFGRMFRRLAGSSCSDEIKALAQQLYDDTQDYDFSDENMACEGALDQLGVVRGHWTLHTDDDEDNGSVN